MPSYEGTKRGYANLFEAAGIRTKYLPTVKAIVDRLIANKATYSNVGNLVGCPWWFVGIIHKMESDANFKRHLHNGDPLSARTVQVPAGRPRIGKPPFTWQESALDALRLEKIDQVPSWEIPRALYEFEKYNGWGYFNRGVNSPYLWSFTSLYSRGKFVKDGVYSPIAVSQQCGAAAILRELLNRS